MNLPFDITAKRKQDVVRMLRGMEKDLDNAPLETLATIFRSLNYMRDCLKIGLPPKEYEGPRLSRRALPCGCEIPWDMAWFEAMKKMGQQAAEPGEKPMTEKGVLKDLARHHVCPKR